MRIILMIKHRRSRRPRILQSFGITGLAVLLFVLTSLFPVSDADFFVVPKSVFTPSEPDSRLDTEIPIDEPEPPETTAEPEPVPPYVSGYNSEFIARLTDQEQDEAEYFYDNGYIFFRQNWSYLKDLPYGPTGFDFGQCGCGPTCVAAIIANLAGVPVTPEEMGDYAIENKYVASNGGTAYSFMREVPAKYGISSSFIYASDKASLFKALRDGKLVLATMGPGEFTLGSHFMLFRGITYDDKILIADSYSFEHSTMEWDYDRLYKQIKSGYWVYEYTGETY